jgi:hypothetical protein
LEGARLIGTPPADHHGSVVIAITASDGLLSVTDHFRLTIDPVNDAPVLLTRLRDLTSAEDIATDFALPAGVFADVDGTQLRLSARLADGSALPEWLQFDGVRFTGTPPADLHGALDVEVSASDGELTAVETFRLTLTPVNDRPAAAAPLADISVDEDQLIDVALPDGVFADVDGDALMLSATLADGATLPDWLRFDGGRLTGTPPAHEHGIPRHSCHASDGVLSASQASTHRQSGQRRPDDRSAAGRCLQPRGQSL